MFLSVFAMPEQTNIIITTTVSAYVGSNTTAVSGDGTSPYHPDFGVRCDHIYLLGAVIGDEHHRYQADASLEVATYFNEFGYTTLVAPIPGIVGYGNSMDEAKADAIAQLVHIRNTYASIAPHTGTPGALAFRAKLEKYLPVLSA
jgi:hypothetical protein